MPSGNDPAPSGTIGPAPATGNFSVQLIPATDEYEPEIKIDSTGPHTEEELQLKAKIDSTETTLRTIPTLKKDQLGRQRLKAYLTKLVWIGKAGLEPSGDAKLASLALDGLRNEVLWREGPTVKNDYMRTLGQWALISAAAAVTVYIAIGLIPVDRMPRWFGTLLIYKSLLILWVGAMIGSWLSFGIRRVELSFIDLGRPESDMLEPSIRLVFTGLLALTLSAVFLSGMIQIQIGNLETVKILHPVVAVTVGLFCGIGEQALPNTIGRRASQFLDEVGK